jgi:hypothetical protein
MENMEESKLNSEKIWKIWKISVLVIITPKETSSSAAAYSITLKFHPKHVTNKNKTKHIVKISHIYDKTATSQ